MTYRKLLVTGSSGLIGSEVCAYSAPSARALPTVFEEIDHPWAERVAA